MSQAKKLAHLISAYGRNGDDMLVHMSRDEVRALHLMGGIAGDGMTINPDTGLPEAFNLSWLIPIAAIAAMALTGGASAAALAPEAAGATATAGAGLGAAATDAALTTAATTATPAALAAAAPTAATVAGTTAAGTGAGIGAAANAASTLAAPAATSVASAAPAAEAASTLGKMADFATENPLITVYGLNALGNAFTPEVKQQDDSNSDPGLEFRPGEGRVPFETRGVRSFNPNQISPSGVEQNWISYGPSVPFSSSNSGQIDTRNFRRFADGGVVRDKGHLARMNAINSQGIAQAPVQSAGTYGDMLAQMKSQYARPYMPSQDMQDGQFVSGNAGKAAMMGHLRNNSNPTMQNAGNTGAPPPAPPPHDPSWYVQNIPGMNNQVASPVAMPVAPQGGQMPQQNINDIMRPPVQNYADGGEVGIRRPDAIDREIERRMRQAAEERAARGEAMRKSASYPASKHPTYDLPDSGWRRDDERGRPTLRDPFMDRVSLGTEAEMGVRKYLSPAELYQEPQGAEDDYPVLARRVYLHDLEVRKRQDQFDYNGWPMAAGSRDMPRYPAMEDPRYSAAGAGFAAGGPVAPMGGMPQMPAGGPPMAGIAQGVQVPPVAPAAPMGVPMDAPMPGGGQSSPDDQKLIQLAAAAMTGKIPNGEKILQLFVAKFGPGALKQLQEMINPQPSENVGRLMQGPGTGTSDSIPAVIDGHQPAALSTGEFVVPAKAVRNLGGGSTEAGANKLQSMVNTVSKAPGRGSSGVVDDPEVMSI